MPIVVPPASGLKIDGPVGGPLLFKVRAAQTHGAMTVLENVIPPGQGPPLHLHTNEDEALYVLEGQFCFKLQDDVLVAPAGSFVFIPRGTAHCFQNIAPESSRILVIFTPAGMERFFDEFAALPSPDPEAFARIGEPVGMKVLGPPLPAPGRVSEASELGR
ncbi:MAG: cupin domain-containing protein [Solirubrobacteraceae bacterium]